MVSLALEMNLVKSQVGQFCKRCCIPATDCTQRLLSSIQAKSRLSEMLPHVVLFSVHFNDRFLDSAVPQPDPCLHLLSHQKHTSGLLPVSPLPVTASKGCSETTPAQTKAFTRTRLAAACAQDLKETTQNLKPSWCG